MITYYVLNTIFVHRGNYASYCILANMPYIAKWMINSDPVKITPNQLVSATNIGRWSQNVLLWGPNSKSSELKKIFSQFAMAKPFPTFFTHFQLTRSAGVDVDVNDFLKKAYLLFRSR